MKSIRECCRDGRGQGGSAIEGMMAREIYKELEYGLKQPQSLGSCVWETPVPGHPSFGKQDRALHGIKIRSLFCAGAVAEDGPRLCMWQGRLSLWDHLQGCPGAEYLRVSTRMHTGADRLYAIPPVCPGAGASVQLLLVCRCRVPLCGVRPPQRCSPCAIPCLSAGAGYVSMPSCSSFSGYLGWRPPKRTEPLVALNSLVASCVDM